MRVLHVVSSVDEEVGGSATAALHAAGYQRAAGIDAVVASTESRPGTAGYIAKAWPNLPVLAFPQRAPRHYCNSRDLRRWLRDEIPGFDVVAVHGVFKIPFVDAASICRRRGVPYLIHPHSSLDPHDLRKHRQLKAVYGPLVVRRMLSGSAEVLATSNRERDRLVTYGATPRVEVVPLAVPGPPAPPDGGRFRRTIGVGADAEMVLFLSRIDPKKGIERLLAAVAQLRADRPKLALVIAGGAEVPAYRDQLQRIAREQGVDDLVIWTGLLSGQEKWDALAAADLFVLPSDYENFGIVVIEALRTGTPVLISDGVDLAEELAGVGGAFVCGTDVASLAAGVSEVLDDPGRARASAAAGNAFVVKEYAPEAVTSRTLEIYERVAGSRKVAT